MNRSSKRFVVLLMSMIMVFGISFSIYAVTPQVETTLVIVHTNDTHGRLEEGKYDGMGFARLSTKINMLEAEYGEAEVIVLDAGDTMHGPPIATVSKGESVVKIMNAIGYDAMTPGNHDFNYGQERLVEISTLTDFPILSANVIQDDGETLLKPYIIEEVAGKKIGIFGLSTPETTYKTNPNNVKGLTFESPVTIAQKMVEELEDQADFIIALAHLGVDEGNDTSEKVAQEVTGIDLIVDGHSHTTLPEGRLVNDTYIVQAGEYDKNLGIVTIEFLNDGTYEVTPSLLTKEEGISLEEDEVVLETITDIKEEFEALTSGIVGETVNRLEGEREAVRTGESTMGNLITNAMLDVTGADIALTNGGGIRASIEAGEVTKGDIINVLPFGNYIVTLEVTGQEILDSLEVGIDEYPASKGSFPHVGGIKMTFDPSLPGGERVVSVTKDGMPIDPSATYVLATNDFIKVGGDDYTMFADNPVLIEYAALDEAVIEYMSKYGTEGITVEGRVVMVESEMSQMPTKPEIPVEPKEELPTIIEHEVYIIVEGDTLAKIAAKYNTTYQELATFNNIENPHMIYVGNTILVPVR